jgi:hypothetical protein
MAVPSEKVHQRAEEQAEDPRDLARAHTGKQERCPATGADERREINRFAWRDLLVKVRV